nr:fibrillin 2-like protein [Yponomeuta cagnagella]
MKSTIVIYLVLCCFIKYTISELSPEELAELKESCCSHGETQGSNSRSRDECASVGPPDDLDPDDVEQVNICVKEARACCLRHYEQKDDCAAGMAFAAAKRCVVPKTDIGKTCCDECSFGQLTGESQGREGCGEPASDYLSPTSALRKNAYHQCCLEAAERMEATTTQAPTTTEKKLETTTQRRERCKKDSCEHVCKDDDGLVTCQCWNGFQLNGDGKTCKDINECALDLDNLCPGEGTVCHNTVGSYKCVPIRKRDVGRNCPPGFKKNDVNQVCDDINECQLPRPPCPKYLCENTIGGYSCAGKPGKPVEEGPRPPAKPRAPDSPEGPTSPKSNMCPPGFRSGPDDECLDIDECEEHLDDCQRLSQHCINTHGSFFCQDHVSKRCGPGFVVNRATGICEDINECEENSEACKRSEFCVNLAGAYDCKSKISTLPKLGSQKCQEGTRARSGGNGCEDIDECRDGTHLCDALQNCINTYGGHECRCKNGFELDPATGSCVDIDECTLKADSCAAGMFCLNVPGSYTCTRRAPSSSTTAHPPEDYEYFYSDEDEDASAAPNNVKPKVTRRPPPTTSTTPGPTTPKPTIPKPQPPPRPPLPPMPTLFPRPTLPPRPVPPPTTPRPTTTAKPTTTEAPMTTEAPTTPEPSTTTLKPTTKPPTTPVPFTPPPTTPRLYNPYPRPFTNQPPIERPWRLRPTEATTEKPELPEATIPAPTEVNVIETESSNGTYSLDTGDIPKDTWTNVIGREPVQPDPDFDLDNLHCLNGYEKNDKGKCVDIDECSSGRFICGAQELCVNDVGGYYCDCAPGYVRNPTGWCTVETTSSTTTSTTTSTTALPPRSPPDWTYSPPSKPRERLPPIICELGYEWNFSSGTCVDIDECVTGKASCSAGEQCKNTDGGYRCITGLGAPGPSVPSVPAFVGTVPRSPRVITVGSQYGSRGARFHKPTYARLPGSGSLHIMCPWGYRLTENRQCLDIDECALRSSECGAEQNCENFPGGYSCQCPAGHMLDPADHSRCVDIDECAYNNPCLVQSQCINTVGSYRCACGAGFRNAPSNDRICVDVDECSERPEVCQQGCINVWGGYRCTCSRGYRLSGDNSSTCTDVDECAETAGRGGRLCAGDCVNVPGSYRCACPGGYKASDDGRNCIDIDECETGVATCANAGPGQVCQNTRGGYHCHTIECPPGYRLESKHICRRIQQYCAFTDRACQRQPGSYSYNFITFASNIYLPTGGVNLFTVHGPAMPDAILNFELQLTRAHAPQGVRPTDLACFDMRPSAHHCAIALLCSLQGPQVAELELTMTVYQQGQYVGNMVARVIVIVSQYDF